MDSSSHWMCSVIKGVLKKFRKFHTKTPALESLFNKVTDLKTLQEVLFSKLLKF